MFVSEQHPRDSRGRFARKGTRAIAAEGKRDEVSASIPTELDRDHEDDRTPGTPGYNPEAALRECHDLWGSGAWPDENAVYNLAEVMDHVGRLLSIPVTDGYDTGNSDDFHPYTPDATGPNPLLCSVCGDDEGANDHQDPTEHARVWMDVEGLTLSDIDTLDHYVSVVTRKLDEAGEYDTATFDVAQLVSDWINGTTVQSAEYRSRFLEYPGALDSLMAFVSVVLAERHPSDCAFCASGESMQHTYEPPSA